MLCCSQHSRSQVDTNQQDISTGLASLNKQLLQEKELKNFEIQKLNALIALAQAKLKEASIDKIKFDKSSFQVKNVPLTEYFSKLILPEDFYSVISKENFTIAFMLQIKFIPFSIICIKCNSDMQISYCGTGYAYHCFYCSYKNSVKSVTCFQGSPVSLQKAILLIFLWVLGIRDREIANILEVTPSFVALISRKIRIIAGEEYKKELPQFSGIVEVDEFDFIKRKIEIGKSKCPKKWIFVMIERKTKVIYVEYIPERSKRVIVPIIQKLCLPGTVIITRAWAGYGRLEDLGYCHYIFDERLGFSDPSNKHIHHNTLKSVVTWLKYNIKTKNRIGCHLQEYILEWLWKKKNSSKKKNEPSNMILFKAILARIKEIPKIS